MSRLVASTARTWLALAAVVGGAILMVLPSLVAPHATPSTALVLAALTIAVVALAVNARVVISPLAAVTSRPCTTHEVPWRRTGEATDAPHHPLQPRAPGLV